MNQPIFSPGGPNTPPFPGGSPAMPQFPSDKKGRGKEKQPKAPKSPKAPKASRQTSARSEARRTGAIAFVLAILASVGAFVVLRGAPPEPTVFVVKAKELLQAGVPVQESQLVITEIPASAKESSEVIYSTSEDRVRKLIRGEVEANTNTPGVTVSWQIVGKRPKYPVLTGQQIRFSPVFSDGFELARPLTTDERLVTVTITPDRALLGVLKPGDTVDVAVPVEETGEVAVDPSSRDAVVLAYGAEIVATQNASLLLSATSRQNELGQAALPGDPIPTVYILRVSTQSAWPIINADSSGRKMYLVLSNYAGIDSLSPNQTSPQSSSTPTTKPTTATTTVPSGG
jgi:Flp pilus assembly protein CpaB